MGISQARGAILEEVILHLLEKVGYRTLTAGDDGTRGGAAGIEICGRGEWHQIDSVAAFDFTPAFMYPLRLLVEAKCYVRSRPVGIEVARNSLGVITDISQNYFTLHTPVNNIQVQRYNYHAAMFSTSGFTNGAIQYAIAHQIFPIQYKDVPLMDPVADLLLGLRPRHFVLDAQGKWPMQGQIRGQIRNLVETQDAANTGAFTDEGFGIVREVAERVRNIGGSYFGMLQGRWPLHLLAVEPLPPGAFQQDGLSCRVSFTREGTCFFRPSEYGPGTGLWFELQFNLPAQIVSLLRNANYDPVSMAEIKREFFSFITISGIIGGIRRQVRLELNEDLLDQYIREVRLGQVH